MADYNEVIRFWFEELEPTDWWKKDAKLDEHIARRFMDLHQAAVACELYSWRESALGRLAEIIVLDQFSRNIHRDTPLAFANDPISLALAQEAIAQGADKRLTEIHRTFLYMPFMHSESALIHEWALELFEANGIDNSTRYERAHKAIIDRFGRYPHRNAILGRRSTAAEVAFLKEPGSSF
ncbi:DUF924 domain-containing protein [Proteobacteria bacterium 005FR1]|nr:DUF924 domain-containing protein [Proteobacteria bacterium 005FR1]